MWRSETTLSTVQFPSSNRNVWTLETALMKSIALSVVIARIFEAFSHSPSTLRNRFNFAEEVWGEGKRRTSKGIFRSFQSSSSQWAVKAMKPRYTTEYHPSVVLDTINDNFRSGSLTWSCKAVWSSTKFRWIVALERQMNPRLAPHQEISWCVLIPKH